jgi:uncharacterized protein YbbC (DUF1343 family)
VFRLGIDTLLESHRDWLEGRRVGLVSHRAAVGRDGVTSAARLRAEPGVDLVALFGPEHGFSGQDGAGELTPNALHPTWRIPIYSLYGETRQPTPAMLDSVDVLVVELQDLGARPYTYVSTLRLILETAALRDKTVIVADRPVPLPTGVDGPMMDPAFETFVGFVPTPMQYGMTQAETAFWLARRLSLSLDLRAAPMQAYGRESTAQPFWPPWVPPSPRIRSWESASLFTCTVCGEALPGLDYGSGTEHSFQILGAPWLQAARLLDALNTEALPGVGFEPIRYGAVRGLHAGTVLDGLHIILSDVSRFRPVTTSLMILDHIQRLYGREALWSAPGTRPEWFDNLLGTDRVRKALMSGQDWREISATWAPEGQAFVRDRAPCLLYEIGEAP